VALAEQYPGRSYQDRAAEIFGQLNGMTVSVPERICFEIINHQAATAVLRNDLEAFESYIEGAAIIAGTSKREEFEQ
jgi:hypothetical protein